MNSGNHEVLNGSAGTAYQNFDTDRMPTLTFTEAVRNLDLNRIQQRARRIYKTTEKPVRENVTCESGFGMPQASIDNAFEQQCSMKLEHTLEQYRGRTNEKRVDVEDEKGVPLSANISPDFNSVEFNDLRFSDSDFKDLDNNDDIDWSDNVDCFTPSLEESYYSWNEKWKSTYEKYPSRSNVFAHNESPRSFEQYTTKMYSTADSHMSPFSLENEEREVQGKRCLCRHFLKGWCKRGNACDFQHDASIFCSNDQMVFLGGLPNCITSKLLTRALRMQGYTVVNKPKILNGFSPQICLGSAEEAQNLIRRGKVWIEGISVDVRPYEEYMAEKPKFKSEHVARRSAPMEGLPRTTEEQLKSQIMVTASKPAFTKLGCDRQPMPNYDE